MNGRRNKRYVKNDDFKDFRIYFERLVNSNEQSIMESGCINVNKLLRYINDDESTEYLCNVLSLISFLDEMEDGKYEFLQDGANVYKYIIVK